MGKTIAKWTVLVMLMAYAIGMSIWANRQAAHHTCTGIDVNIKGLAHADSVTTRGVMAELARYPQKIVGAPFNTINTLQIQRYLQNFSNFEDVECLISSQGRLMVNIVPMVPEIRVFDGADSYYVNKDGKRIDSNAEFYSNVPVVVGHFSRSLPPSYILPVTRFIASDSLLKQIVGMVKVKDRHNILLIPRFEGQVVNFGDTTRLPQKRRALLTAYQKILPYKGWEYYDTISVKFKGQIVATRRNKTPLHPVKIEQETVDPEEASLPTEGTPLAGQRDD